MSNQSVTYLDETTFNLWQRPNKVWMHKRHMDMPMQANRGQSITLIGALHSTLGLVHFEVFAGSNNKIIFASFIENLLKKLGKFKTVLVMDNLAIHHCSEIQDQIEKSKHDSIFTPPYSCSLNSIEPLWHLIKMRWRAHLLSLMGEKNKY